MQAPQLNKVVGKLAALMLACCAHAALGSGRAAAQPPLASSVQSAAVAAQALAASQAVEARKQGAEHARVAASETPRPALQGAAARSDSAPTKAAPQTQQLPPLPSRLERLGGAHAKRAMHVAQGIATGRVALRPMFWMTRDRRGGMVALGGRF